MNLRPAWTKESHPPPGNNASSEYQEARRVCAKHSPRAIQRQIEMMESDDERVAFMATEAILNRGIGKPRDHSQEDQARSIINLDGLSDEERMLLAKLLLKTMPKQEGQP